MTPFFNSSDRIATLDREARTWLGTPFFPHSCAKGVGGGVDCVHLVQDILVACGAMERQALPSFPMDWADHRSESVVLGVFTQDRYFAEHFVALPFPETPAQPGDILCFKVGACVHHIGLMLPGQHFIHALKPEGATILPLDVALAGQKLLGKIVRLYRPIS